MLPRLEDPLLTISTENSFQFPRSTMIIISIWAVWILRINSDHIFLHSELLDAIDSLSSTGYSIQLSLIATGLPAPMVLMFLTATFAPPLSLLF